MRGFWAILIKELAHIRRDRSTIFFAIVVPAVQLTIFGFAANVTVDNIPLVVFDLDGRQESRQLVDAVVNTRVFRVAQRVHDEESFRRAIASGRAKAGLLIPANYSERLLRREQARVQVLVDGSDSQVATTTLNTIGLLTTHLSIGRARVFAEALQTAPTRDEAGRPALPIEGRARLLFNPDLEDSFFFVPGLIAIILQTVLAFLTSVSIVKEREMGTLEQLFVTPVSPAGLLLGKLTPFVLLACAELLIVLVVMVGGFGVPIHGSLALLLALSALFIFTALGLGLMVSTLARTQFQAMQFALMIMLPSVLLSGFVFPRSEMPWPLYAVGMLLPVTYFLEILRGVILRAADARDLLPSIAGLAACAAAIVGLSLARFRKQLD
jgi:ribosome-dependent ATPase